MNCFNAVKAASGFTDLPAGLKWYTSFISQESRFFVSSQLESTLSDEG